jgi:hypothetical protein
MSLIINSLGLSYKFPTPHPFDEKEFLGNLKDTFIQSNILGVDIAAPDQTYPVYTTKSGTCELNFQPKRGVVGVKGNNFSEVNSYFVKINEILSDKMEVNINEVDYLELVGDGRYKSKEIPLETISKNYNLQNVSIIQEFFNNEEIIPFVIRCCSKEALDNKRNIREVNNWLELLVMPLIVNPSFYYWQVILRNDDVSKVKLFWNDIESKINQLFTRLEA